MSQEAAVVYVTLQGKFEEFERRINQLESDASDAGERAGSGFGSKFSAGLTVAAGGLVALTGAVTALVGSTVGLAQEAAQNVNEFQAKLGATREEAERLGTVAEQVFGDNWTGSLEEAGAAVATVRKEIKGLTDEELREVTGGVVAISETFEQEQGKIAAAVAALMDATGASVQEATDAITTGFQRGLDSSGDLADALAEYSPQFKEMGLSLEQVMSVLETGAAKGALGVDKVADTMGEFRKIVSAGGKDVVAAFDELGLSGEKVVEQISNGNMSLAEAFALAQGKLKDVDDTVKQNQIGVALMGTLWEDLGGKAVLGIDLTKTSLKDMEGATASLNAKYNNLGQFVEGMWRKVQVALLPVGKEILGMANEAVPYLSKAFDQMGQKLPGLIKQGISTAKEFGTTAVNVYNSVKPAIEGTVVTVQKLSTFIERNKEVLIPLTAAVGAGVAAYGAYRAGIVAVTAAKAAWTVATTTATAASVAFRAAIAFLTGPVGLAIAAIGLLVGAGVALYRNWDEVKAWAEKTWGRIKEIVHNAIEGAVNYLKGIDMKQVGLDIVMGLVNGILAGPRLVLAAARGLGSAVIRGVKDILNMHSPSRVMQELGEFTSEGFVKGIESRKPSVIASAKDTAKGFLDAFKELKLERSAGLIDLGPYIQTLEKAAASLKAKMATVKEGTPAYREWLSALSAVQVELGSVKGKSSETASAAKSLNDEIKRGREQIAQIEGMEKYVAGLRTAKDAQLSQALAIAKTNGETEKYKAIRDELDRRADAGKAAQDKVAEATRKAAEAVKEQREEIAKNRDQIIKSEAWDKYVAGLKDATDAQLSQAKATAFAHGETEKYTAIKDEQKRRVEAVSDAQNKAAAAAKREADAVAEGRKAIADAREYEAWKAGLVDLTDAQLAQATATAEASGKQSRHNDLMAEAKRRADEAAEAVTAYAQGLRDASDALDDVANNPNDYADGKGVLQSAQAADQTKSAAIRRQVYSDLFDTLSHLDDATIDNAETMEVLDEMLQNAAKSGAITSEELKILQGVLRDAESEASQLAKGLEEGAAALNSVLASPIGERTFRPDEKADAQQATFQNILDTLLGLDDATIQNTDTMSVYADMIENAGKNGAVTADQLKYLKAIFESVASSVDAMNQGLIDSEQALKDVQANPVGEGAFRPDPRGDAQRETFNNLKTALTELDVEALKNADTMKFWSGMIDNAAKSGGITTDQAKALTEQLTHQKGVADEATKAHEKWADNLTKIAHDEWVSGLKSLTDAELAAGLAATKAAEKTDDYNAYLAEGKRRSDEAAKNTDLLSEARRKLTEAQQGGAKPFASELAALEAMRGKPGVIASELDDLIAAYKKLQAETEQKKGLENKMNTWGNYAKQLVPVVTGAMEAMGDATSDVAAQWGADLGNMVTDLTNFGMAIAKGDYLGAAIHALTTIFNWFSRNKKAAEDAAKATKAYNDSFKFSDNGYNTRQVTTYTTGFLFWETTHYTEQIDEMKKAIALGVEGGFINGIKDGFTQALAKNDFSLFEKSLKTSVGKAVLDGLIESFINQAILKRIIGPAIDAYLETGDTTALRTAIQAATGEAQKFYDDVLKPIADEFGLLGTDVQSDAQSTSKNNQPANPVQTVKVEMPQVQATMSFDALASLATVTERSMPVQMRFADVLERATPVLEQLSSMSGKLDAVAQSMLNSSGLDAANVSRLERILSATELKPNLRDARGL